VTTHFRETVASKASESYPHTQWGKTKWSCCRYYRGARNAV